MRKGIILSIFITSLLIRVGAQEVIHADTLQGCDSLMVAFSLENAQDLSAYSSLHWDFDDGTAADGLLDPSHQFGPGSFHVSCLIDGNRTITSGSPIEVRQSPVAAFAWKDSSSAGSELTYFFISESLPGPGVSYDYHWELPESISYSTISFLHRFTAEGVIPVIHTVTDDAGCSDTLLKKIPVSHSLIVANVFSPNGDGINDYFEVTTSGELVYRLTIFTRTGSTVYISESPVISWDGRTFSGREVPEGVYYYVIEGLDEGASTGLCGFLQLYR